MPDALAELGELAKTPEANIIKLPNISASIAAAQGGDQGAAGRGLRRSPTTRTTRGRTRRRPPARPTTAVKGSAVNPVLREGNSDRRAPASVKEYARNAPALDGRVVDRTRSPTWRR